jgi:hypothetical protein
MTRFGKLLISTAAAAIFAMPVLDAWASGSVGAAASPPNPYRNGQMVYARKVACKTCAFPGGLKDMESVKRALQQIQGGELGLSPEERSAVTDYINRRFKGN